jgi:hypothetical protein
MPVMHLIIVVRRAFPSQLKARAHNALLRPDGTRTITGHVVGLQGVELLGYENGVIAAGKFRIFGLISLDGRASTQI